jgi:hypothetical protein
MNVRHLTDHVLSGYSDTRPSIRAGRHTGAPSLRPVVRATGWILFGAGVGSLAIVAVVWALMSFTAPEGNSDTWPLPKVEQHPLVR